MYSNLGGTMRIAFLLFLTSAEGLLSGCGDDGSKDDQRCVYAQRCLWNPVTGAYDRDCEISAKQCSYSPVSGKYDRACVPIDLDASSTCHVEPESDGGSLDQER